MAGIHPRRSVPDLPHHGDPEHIASRRARSTVFERLYTGNGAFDIVGHSRRWYVLFGVLMLVCVASMVLRGFNLGIEFVGGTRVQLPAQSASGVLTTERVGAVFTTAVGREPVSVQVVGTGDTASMQIKTETLSAEQVARLKTALVEHLHPIPASGPGGEQAISDSAVSGSWGGEISQQALIALAVFLVLVTLFLAVYFERWMAVAALVALLHDIVVTAGVYSIVGFEVTPATVIGLLTILGFSLYDTVVVFDKVKENTRSLLGRTRRTYGEAANLAVNQTLMRSINTSLIALLPVTGLLAVGVGLLGVGTLKDLALVQLTGLIAGALSSIFLATPLLVDLKMRDPRYRQQAARVTLRRANLPHPTPARTSATAAGPARPGRTNEDEDETVDAELRRERAIAAASGVPVRNPRARDAKRTRATGRSGRPTGKQHRQGR